MASAGQTRVLAKRCGNSRYRPACTKPNIKNTPLSPRCVKTGTEYKLPAITFTSNSGIRKIQVREGTKTVKLITFKGQGPTQHSLKGLLVPTAGLSSGAHQLSVTVTDIRGRSVSKTLRFSICVATPVFTG